MGTSATSQSIVPTSLETTFLRDSIDLHRARLIDRLEAGEDGMSLGRANARFLNACIALLFETASRRAGLPSGVALGAVGSFGRGAVALHSDADVVLVFDPQVVGPKEAATFAEALLYPLWDATLAVGHQVLGASEAVSLAQNDLATATALLDMRHLVGDATLLRELVDRAHEGLFGEKDLDAFIDRLESEGAARHARFGDSVFLLEPDIKSGPGGLRDLDGARWAARARYRVNTARDDGPLGTWGELVRLGVMVAREAQEIAQSEEFLWRVRNRLHARATRKADRLDFEEQEALAVAMKYGTDRAQAAERLMQAFYLSARAATRARASLFERVRPPRRREKPPPSTDVGGGIQLFDGYVTIADSGRLQPDPALAMRAFAECVRHKAPLLPFARAAISAAAADPEWCERLRTDTEAAALFLELVCTVRETDVRGGSILRLMHDAGLVVAMVPEFFPVTGRVHHDTYHVYTVDVHSVAAVERLAQMARGELAHAFPLASRLAAEIARPKPLFLATLLHDIGKGWPDASGSRKNHSGAGAELCERILPRLGMSTEDVAEARQLVLDHLRMYHVATRRDLDDTATIEEFCRNVYGREGLRNLYLLTVADVSTTSPTALTSWKAQMLEELYFAAEAHLAGQAPRADAERIDRVYNAVRSLWTGPREAIDAVLSSLPERYLLANSPESIVEHARALQARAGRAAHVVRVASRHREAIELCVVADDRPGLLASIAAALTANRLEVLTAEVYSHPVGAEREALDLFWVRDRHRGAGGVEASLPKLAQDLEDVCSGRVNPADLLRERAGSTSRWRERPSPAVPTEVLFDNRASPRHTVIEVYAKDRLGLLYTLAEELHRLGLSITLSKINTEGARVADVFYVSESDGSKILLRPRQQEIREALVKAAESD
ncbi:MAG: [protein-PII] uridylyltransferase [Myxococcota bacterium]|nr:[protein-PII] uridylyltransferase [Myxococcota bacterium]